MWKVVSESARQNEPLSVMLRAINGPYDVRWTAQRVLNSRKAVWPAAPNRPPAARASTSASLARPGLAAGFRMPARRSTPEQALALSLRENLPRSTKGVAGQGFTTGSGESRTWTT